MKRRPSTALLFALVGIAVGCTSVTNTLTGDEGEGGQSSAGSGGAGTGGDAGTGGAAATGGSAAGACDSTLAAELNAACVEDLGGGRLRITYDFETDAQLDDWGLVVEYGEASKELAGGRLVITAPNPQSAYATFRKRLHTERLSFAAVALTGADVLLQINAPELFFSANGCYGDHLSRGFIVDDGYEEAELLPIEPDEIYRVTATQSDTELVCDYGDVAITREQATVPLTDRILAIGAYASTIAFDDVVFEGTLDD